MILHQHNSLEKVAFGGGCHWCTEAYFQSLKGVTKTEQGWISSTAPHDSFSEAVIVHYDPKVIPLNVLVAIHLHTHACTKNHSMREKYRSAIYVFGLDTDLVGKIIASNQFEFTDPIITQVLPFKSFRMNAYEQQNYYQKKREGIFCKRYIHPKLQMMEKRNAGYFKKI